MKSIQDFVVVSNRVVADSCNELILRSSDSGEFVAPRPGQFVNIQCPEGSVLLRRPISIADFSSAEKTLTILVQAVGKGSKSIVERPIGSTLSLVYPLGNTFPLEGVIGRNILLIGGGVGVAPLLFYGKFLTEQGANVRFLLGARNASRLILPDAFRAIAPTQIFTEDGSLGYKGLVTESDLFADKSIHFIATCGPLPMMRAVVSKASQHNIECYVSLENVMACGIGACLCCVTPTSQGNKCVCTSGPVFNSKDLLW